VNAPQSRRFAQFECAWDPRQSRFAGDCGVFSIAFYPDSESVFIRVPPWLKAFVPFP
jgi:hypothetical protein